MKGLFTQTIERKVLEPSQRNANPNTRENDLICKIHNTKVSAYKCIDNTKTNSFFFVGDLDFN